MTKRKKESRKKAKCKSRFAEILQGFENLETGLDALEKTMKSLEKTTHSLSRESRENEATIGKLMAMTDNLNHYPPLGVPYNTGTGHIDPGWRWEFDSIPK